MHDIGISTGDGIFAKFIKTTLMRFRLARKVRNRDGEVFFRVYWSRLLLAFCALVLIGWASLAGAAYFFLKYERDFAEVKYFDLFFPHRWEEYRVARGDYYVEEAMRILEDGERNEIDAFFLLNTGVNLSPENDEGRILLAGFLQRMGRSSTAIRVMEARVEENRHNVEYLQQLFMLLFDNFQDERVQEIGMSLLEQGDGDPRRNHMVATAVATASFYRGDFEETERLVREYDLTDSKDGFMLQTRMDWERGNEDLAVGRLEEAVNSGRFDDEVLLVLIEFLLRQDREDRAARFALMRHFADPLNFEPLLGLIHVYREAEERDAYETEVETYLRQFGREQEPLERLAMHAGESGNPELARRIYELCRENGLPAEAAAYHLVEAHVVAGEYRQALNLVSNWEEEPESWDRGFHIPLKPLVTAAQYGVGNRGEGEFLINEIFAQGFMRPDHLDRLAKWLIEIGENGRARQVLAFARNNHPHYQPVLSRLIELDIATGRHQELFSNLKRYISMRRPSTEVLEKAYSVIGSDRFLYYEEREDVLYSLENVLGES